MAQKQKAIPLKQRLQYRLDNFMSKGGMAVFLALLCLFFIAFVIMSTVRMSVFWFFPDAGVDGLSDLNWRVFFQIIDSGSLAELDAGSNLASKLVGIVTIFFGLVLFSSMVAFITQQFEERLALLRKGRSAVLESGHTLVLGFGDRLVDMLRELIIANESESDAVVVVLAQNDKEQMDDYLREQILDWQTTRMIVRSGNTASLPTLRKVGVEHADSIVILSDAKPSQTLQVKELADARVIKAIMAVLAITGDRSGIPIVAELHLARNRELAESVQPGRVTTLDETDLLARMLVQTSRSVGLSVVYSDLVGFEGNEFYFFRPKQGWGPLTFGQLQLHFQRSVPLGVRNVNHQIRLNPPPDYPMLPEDEVVILAEDDSTIKFFDKPVMVPITLSYSEQRASVPKEKHLIIHWTTKTPIVLKEYASYLTSGSQLHLVVQQNSDVLRQTFTQIAEQNPNVVMQIRELDLSRYAAIRAIRPHRYNTVAILGRPSATAEEIDTRTLLILLQMRRHFRAYAEETGETVTTKLITEVVESENTELVVKTGVRDFLLSNRFISKIFAQAALNPEVMFVYDQLFSAEGSEVYLKSVALYFDPEESPQVSFGDCMLAAQAREEVCFGVKLIADEAHAERNFGVQLIPKRDETFRFEPGDCLITLAEDES